MATSSLSTVQSSINHKPLQLSPQRVSAKLNLIRIPQNHSIHCGYSCFEVKDVSYRPPGTELNLLNKLLSGISKPTSGSICVQRYGNDGNPDKLPEQLSPEKVGIVFQFPGEPFRALGLYAFQECCPLQSRYFVADTIADEVTFGWPRRKSSLQLREHLALNLQRAVNWVGLNGVSLDKDPHSLSGGYKRRLALAIQLVEVPDLLILDEPLAGLDWKARADVVKLLKHLKKELTVLVVSHDLKELAALVDHSWRMEIGGFLREELLPV
uniref:ABC transporter domain-containing protein n=1 Tax=Salix viminalis TaxID=40686 RepID=A0A6N2L9S7_SALVM